MFFLPIKQSVNLIKLLGVGGVWFVCVWWNPIKNSRNSVTLHTFLHFQDETLLPELQNKHN